MMFWFQTSAALTTQCVGFDDVLEAVKNPDIYLLINTLPPSQQNCLIRNTLLITQEEATMNQLLSSEQHYKKRVILYGKNCADLSVEQKNRQLYGLGFREVYVYRGGMLEWSLLQDIYGQEEFPTTISPVSDLLQFQQTSLFKTPRLYNG